MQKWEYLVAKWVGDDAPKVQLVNGEALPDSDSHNLHTFLSQAGEDGWELVGTVNRGASPAGLLIFKRPKS